MKIDPSNRSTFQAQEDVFDLNLKSSTHIIEEKVSHASTIIPFTMITVSVVACGRSINRC